MAQYNYKEITAEMMKEVCHNVSTEPHLQPVTREQLRHRTANREEGARLDVVVTNFWGRDRQQAYFDIGVFNPFAQTHRTSTLSQCHKRQEQEKRRTYEASAFEKLNTDPSLLSYSAPLEAWGQQQQQQPTRD